MRAFSGKCMHFMQIRWKCVHFMQIRRKCTHFQENVGKCAHFQRKTLPSRVTFIDYFPCRVKSVLIKSQQHWCFKTNKITWLECMEHFGMISLRCWAIRSRSWLTMKEGGMCEMPPRGMLMVSRQMGHLKVVESRFWASTILSRQFRHTVCEQGSNLGVCS